MNKKLLSIILLGLVTNGHADYADISEGAFSDLFENDFDTSKYVQDDDVFFDADNGYDSNTDVNVKAEEEAPVKTFEPRNSEDEEDQPFYDAQQHASLSNRLDHSINKTSEYAKYKAFSTKERVTNKGHEIANRQIDRIEAIAKKAEAEFDRNIDRMIEEAFKAGIKAAIEGIKHGWNTVTGRKKTKQPMLETAPERALPPIMKEEPMITDDNDDMGSFSIFDDE